MSFVLAVTGSRRGHGQVEAWLSKLPSIYTLVLGDASGVDTQAAVWACENAVFFVSIGADWKKHGNRAGPIRNGAMTKLAAEYAAAGHPTGCVGFPDAGSIGTFNCLYQMRGANIHTAVVRDDA